MLISISQKLALSTKAAGGRGKWDANSLLGRAEHAKYAKHEKQQIAGHSVADPLQIPLLFELNLHKLHQFGAKSQNHK